MESKLNLDLPFYDTSSLDFYLPFDVDRSCDSLRPTDISGSLSGNHPLDIASDTMGIRCPLSLYGFSSGMVLPPTKWKCPFKGVGLLLKDRIVYLHHRVIKDRTLIGSLTIDEIARYDNTYFLRCVMEYTESHHEGVVNTMLFAPFRVIPFSPSEGYLYPIRTFRYEEREVEHEVGGITYTKIESVRVEELRESLDYLRLWYTLFDCSSYVISDDVLEKWSEFADIEIFPVPSSVSDMTLPTLLNDRLYSYSLDMPMPAEEYENFVRSFSNSMELAYYRYKESNK